ELERCIESSLLAKLADRILEENISSAKLKNLARCKKCNFVAEVPSTWVQFECLRDTCGHVSRLDNHSLLRQYTLFLSVTTYQSRTTTPLRIGLS
ncbi:hypothetical protein ElyMa_002632600, partial [Elysia marginata]